VRTAFPTTGGFDEGVTLFCLHSNAGSSRMFSALMRELADVRSVYAPDLPGCGESDPSTTGGVPDAAGAVSDLAGDLRLRQIDVLGVEGGAEVALALCALKPELVRRLVLAGLPSTARPARLTHTTLLMRTGRESAELLARANAALPKAKLVDIAAYGEDSFSAAAGPLASQIGAFLSGAGVPP
jgi:pimeloyl-ACP methyl ester carboxylesterase